MKDDIPDETVKLSFKKKVYIGLIFPFLLSVLTSFTSYLSFKKQADLGESVSHCYKVINTTQNIQELLINLETGQRGYRVTNEKRFLQPYIESAPLVTPSVKELKKLVSDNPAQVSNVILLEKNIDQVLHFWKDESNNNSTVTDEEKRQMDRIRDNIADILFIENTLLTERNNDNNRSIEIASWISVIDALLAVAIIAILVNIIISEFKKRNNILKKLRQFNTELINEKVKLLHSENKLITSHNRLLFHIENTPLGYIEWDSQLHIKTWSKRAEEIFGWNEQEFISIQKNWANQVYKEDLHMVSHIAHQLITGKVERNTTQYRIYTKDGRLIWCEWFNSVLKDKDGKVITIMSQVHDITEMQEAEKALAQSEANLHQIMDLIPQAIFAKDIDGTFIFVNNSFTALYGLTPQQVRNKPMSVVISEENDVENLLRIDREVILSGQPKAIPEYIFIDPSGDTHLLQVLKVPFTVADTNEKAVLGISIDITEQKKAEKERSRIISDLLQRNNDLEQFSYMISHNLRGPVANILGIVNIIRTIGVDADEMDKVTGYLATAAQELDHVITDINQILSLKNNLNKRSEHVSFAQLVYEVKSGLSNTINNEKVKIITDFSVAPEITIVKDYLYSIFYNLISNSIKYHQPGTSPVIEITSSKINNKTELRFKDNGLGIDLNKNSGDLFGLYKRFHYHVPGKGMGLFMVKNQVELLNGKITLTSEVNKGSEVIIELDAD